MNPFQELTDNFFAPLAFRYREHYAQLLLIFYDLFLEYHSGVERALAVSAFEQYFIGISDLSTFAQGEEDDEWQELSSDQEGAAPEPGADNINPRALANRFLRRLIACGWMSEEVLPDFTQILNLTSWAKPFYQALADTARGTQIEYESHIVAIYSSLCFDSAAENGHHAVLNAHYHTRLLMDSLKVLDQNIKTHVQQMFQHEAEVKDILHIHYDIYMEEIVDRAYNRLKTSDNLSKYRPQIKSAIARFLKDEEWLLKTASKLAMIKHLSVDESRKLLMTMLTEIRDDLASLDPILEAIDDKNRRYSGISTERIKSKLYADASLQGRIRKIIQGIEEQDGLHTTLDHRIKRVRFLSRESLFRRREKREVNVVSLQIPQLDGFELEKLQTEMMLKIKNQLNPAKVGLFLNRVCRSDGSPTPAEEIVSGMESFVRLLYAAIYAERGGGSFPFQVVWGKEWVTKGRFQFRSHSFVPRRIKP